MHSTMSSYDRLFYTKPVDNCEMFFVFMKF